MSKPAEPTRAVPPAAGGPDVLPAPVTGLVTMRLVVIFSMLRRTEILAHRKLFELSEIEWQIITYVGERAPFSLSRLAALTMKDEGQLSRAVKKMCTRGLVKRQRKPGGPEIQIELSPEGHSVYRTMVTRAIARDRWLTEELSEEDREALWRITDTMLVKARAMLDNETAAPTG